MEITEIDNIPGGSGDRPSWPGGASAAKPQTGWLFKILKEML